MRALAASTSDPIRTLAPGTSASTRPSDLIGDRGAAAIPDSIPRYEELFTHDAIFTRSADRTPGPGASPDRRAGVHRSVDGATEGPHQHRGVLPERRGRQGEQPPPHNPPHPP